MAQYPIPQFIESEGKITSFLTFKQFFVMVAGGVICLLLYYSLPFSLFAILSVVIVLLVVIVAFLKIDGIPVIKTIFNFLRFAINSKSYIWKKAESPYPFMKTNQTISQTREFSASSPKNNNLQDVKQIVEYRKK